VFNIGGWINPSLTPVNPCSVECSMWSYHDGYFYRHMYLFYVSLPHLLVYTRDKRALVFIIIIVLVLETLGFIRNPYKKIKRERDVLDALEDIALVRC